jgi:hypothetical protein
MQEDARYVAEVRSAPFQEDVPVVARGRAVVSRVDSKPAWEDSCSSPDCRSLVIHRAKKDCLVTGNSCPPDWPASFRQVLAEKSALPLDQLPAAGSSDILPQPQ